jgi:hypothetical protein
MKKKGGKIESQAETSGSCPYESGLIRGRPKIVSRTGLEGRVVAVLTSNRSERGLKLIQPWTRCIKQNEVHEVLLTDEPNPLPGGTVNKVAAIAFIEFFSSGLIMGDDSVFMGGQLIGHIAGFDETHFPNHINIILKGPARKTGLEFGLKGGDRVVFEPKE